MTATGVEPVQLTSFVTALLALTLASYFDLKERRVPNRLWVPPLLGGIPSALILVERGILVVEEVAVSVASAVLIAQALHRLKILGGADCKAIIVSCLLVPVGCNRLPVHFFPLALTTNLFIILGALTVAAAAVNTLTGKWFKEEKRGFSWRTFSPPIMPLMALSLVASFFFGNLALISLSR
ncbi:MAG: prepilin peptidase [Candidatus Jordarchaeales archaeon]